MSTDTPLADALAARTLALINISSVSRDEQAIMAAIRAGLPGGFEEWYADGDALVVATPRRRGVPLVVLAGHVDTVPAQGNLPGRIADGHVIGLGASDMKGGVAVMLEIADWIARDVPERAVDLVWVIFTREELPVSESPLPAAFAACPNLAEAALAIVMEPTDNTVQAGCLGNLNATLRFRGASAHSARPWTGDNAINRAVVGLGSLINVAPRVVEIDGFTFTEVLSITRIHGGIADNVIPDLVECHLNFRFTPDRTLDQACEVVRDLVGGVGELEITSVSPAGRVAPRTPLLERLIASGGFAMAPKQAWTPVAQFTQVGIDAVNFGPGATAMAHARHERIAVAELVRAYDALQRFIGDDGAG